MEKWQKDELSKIAKEIKAIGDGNKITTKEEGLSKVVKDLQEKLTKVTAERDKLVSSRPALLKDDWVMPEAPKCPNCGEALIAEAYFDNNEVSFNWSEWCDSCHNIVNVDQLSFDVWPFKTDYIYPSDAEAAGFTVEL